MNFRGRDRDEVSLDMTPLIDVVFLLLIFFMLTASFTQAQRLKVELPKAEQGETQQEQDPAKDWTIEIDALGNYALNGEALAPEQLEIRLRELPGRTDETVLLIRAAAKAEHQAVVRALDAAKAAGLLHIGLATEPSSRNE